jgi:cytochrome c2
MMSRSQEEWVVKFLAVALLTIALAASVSACRDKGGGGGAAAGTGGNANNGKSLFAAKGCPTCHTLKSVPNATGTIGPDLDGVGSRAGTREQGKSAADYIDESIKTPDAFVVPGYPAPSQGGMILPVPVSDAERKDLVAFLLTQ